MGVMLRPQQQRMLLIAFVFLFAGQLVAGAIEDSRLLLLSLSPLQDQGRPAQDAEGLVDIEDETNGEDESQTGMACLCHVSARLSYRSGFPLSASLHPRDFEFNLLRPPILSSIHDDRYLFP